MPWLIRDDSDVGFMFSGYGGRLSIIYVCSFHLQLRRM